MEMVKITDLVKAVEGNLTSHFSLLTSQFITGVSTDSRTIKQGEVFFALKGEEFDGHNFVEKAIEKGASAVVVEDRRLVGQGFSLANSKPEGLPYILVEDTLEALGDFAKWYRKRFDIPIVAVTGSNGKTTTKEMIAKVLSGKYRVIKSRGNLNNLIGIPLEIFRIDNSKEIGVFELAMSKKGEIARLCSILDPKIGVITNIAPVHLQFFKSVEDIRDAKLEMIKFVNTIVINADDRLLTNVDFNGKKVIKFGLKTQNSKLKTQNYGMAYKYNILAAVAVGSCFGIKEEEALKQLEDFEPLNGRGKIINAKCQMLNAKLVNVKIIDSSYNANPVSVEYALKDLEQIKCKRRIAVLGDMLELGPSAEKFHKKIGKEITNFGIDTLIGFGELAKNYINGRVQGFKGSRGQESYHFSSFDKLIDFLKEYIKEGDAILVKGSRKMRMERIVKEMTKSE